ncbi:MAG: DEAD/DEAH box helicase [Fulvivirga sp.]
MNTFKSLGLSESLLEVLEKMGFTKPTPIQEQSIPLLLDNSIEDFIGLAQTGTGKTAAFGLPLIDLVDAGSKETQALILAPTRELGQQTAKQIVEFSANYKKLNVEVVYGGAAITNQIKALQRPTQIVVATPGRLLDLIRRKAVSLSNVKYLVLDEADEMLNMGFKDEIDAILSNIKVPHNTWLFSATMPSEIRKIVKKYMNNPKEVSVNTKEKTNADITHQYVVTKTTDKLSALQRFLDMHPEMRGIMFCRTKRETQEISDQLSALGYETEALHGDLSQAQRDAAMNRFKARNMQLLVATDVAARGIDVSDLTHVLHHKLPDQLEGYTHRSGRTGRAGKKGLSIVFINSREGRKITELERKLQVKFEAVEVPSIEDLKEVRLQRWAKLILSMPVSKEAEEAFEGIKAQFEDLSKEDLLQRLLAKELKQLSKGSGGNLNASASKGRDDHSKRFFINIGSEDGLTESDLIEFISEVGNVPIQSVGDIALQRKRAFFNLPKEDAKDFPQKFVGLELEGGHAIKVNEENNRNTERRKPSKGGGFRGKGGGRPKQRSSSKGRGYSKRK